MKITLIQPSIGKIIDKPYVKSWQMKPLAIATLAGMTPDHIDIDFFDDRFDDLPFNEPTDLVAMPVETYTAKRAYNISTEFRRRNIPVVMGGIHASLDTNEVMLNADATLVGGAEETWKEILNDAESGKLKELYSARNINGDLPHVKPRRDLFLGKPYLSLEMVETGRGCPFTCDFCAIAGSFEGSYKSKSIEDIVSDVGEIKGKNIYFVDDNFVSRFSRTKDLCDALAPLNKKWFSHGSINMADNTELLEGLSKSGCANILIGFESLNPENLKAMGKSWNIAKRDYSEAVQKLRDNGISIYATFVFGYDHDTQDDFKRTLDFAIEQKFALAAFNHLVPFPSTPLYHRLKEEGRLFEDKWWLKPGYKFGEVAFQPANMSAETLAERCFECREDFYSYSSTFKRSFDLKTNLKSPYQAAMYFVANLVSKKGISQRQYWPIGEVISKGDRDIEYRLEQDKRREMDSNNTFKLPIIGK
jgi:radical SAM superfamily enzyme YgiQ (UPF0313 family)